MNECCDRRWNYALELKMVITEPNIDMEKENWIESLGYLVQRK